MTTRSPEFAGPFAAGSLWLRRLASLKLTLVIIALLLAGSVVALQYPQQRTWPLVVPLALFAVNLGCAILTNATFRRQGALLVFHLALLVIVLLVAAGRLTYLKGHVELTDGSRFEGDLAEVEAGPWHAGRLADVRFENLGFSIEYREGIARGATRNRVRWLDEAGQTRSAVIGDMDPLVVHGYRFYTSFNKGFAPVFLWLPRQGEAVRGSVHLPGYPLNEYGQSQEWAPPEGGSTLWIMLQIDETILDPARPSQFRLPGDHRLVVRAGDARQVLRPGERDELPEGTLVYEGLRAWMGYTVFYDWTLSWLLAAALVACGALGWHFFQRFFSTPWDKA